MSLSCELVVKNGASPEELRDLGYALWGWCQKVGMQGTMYQCVNNQLLADLIAGRLPVACLPSRQAGHPSLRFLVRGHAARDFRPTIDSVRSDLPGKAVEDFVIEGVSWNLID
jgi:hypothetical protein